jgi:hypothetical protein
MKRLIFWMAVSFTVGLSCATVSTQPFPANIAQAIALLTSGTTPFSIVGIVSNGYINWGSGRSDSGYGIRDNSGTIQWKNLNGSWANIGSGGSGGGAPTDATYIVQTPNATLTNEQALSALSTGLLKNTTTTGVLSVAIAGTDYVAPAGNVATATALATPRTIQGVSFNGTANITLFDQNLNTTDSPTFAAVTVSGDFTVDGAMSGNGGSVTDDMTWAANTLGVSVGGTGITSGTSGGILGFTGAGVIASSAALTNHAIVLGGGAGATPTALGSLGTTTTVLHGNAAGAPTFGAVDINTDTTGSLGVARGGTGLASFAVGDLIQASGATTLAALSDVAAGHWLRSGGVTTAVGWSTTTLPNSATTGDVLYASGANTYANLADVAAGSFFRSGGIGAVPAWSTTTWPNATTTGDLLISTGTNTVGSLAAVATGRVLISTGIGVAPSWSVDAVLSTVSVTSATASSYIKATETTFAARPGSPSVGMMVNFSDSTTTTWGANITTGGGANHVQARYNGAQWTVVGK